MHSLRCVYAGYIEAYFVKALALIEGLRSIGLRTKVKSSDWHEGPPTRIHEHDLDAVLSQGLVAAQAPAPQAVLGRRIRARGSHWLHCYRGSYVDDDARPLLDL